MPSTYTLNNGIELIGTGEQSGTWGDTTNTNLELLDTALDGQVTITATSAGTSGSPNDLPISDGSASDGRNRMVIITSATDLGADVYYQLTPNDAEKIIYVRNDLNAQDLILFQGTYSASNDYVVPNGKTAVIFFDGGGAGAVAANVFNNAHFDALNVVGGGAFGGAVTVTTGDSGATASSNADDLVVEASGDGGISILNPASNTGTLFFGDPSAGNMGQIKYSHTDDAMSFVTAQNTAFVIDSNRRVLVGHGQNVGNGSDLQVTGSDFAASSISVARYSNNSSSTHFLGYKSRSGTVGSAGTVLADDDNVLILRGYGDDGTDILSTVADIYFQVDGTPGSNDMPGRIVFSTTSDGASTSTERMRITSSGNVGIASGGDVSLDSTDIALQIGSGSYSNPTIQIRSGTSGTGKLWFGDNSGTSQGRYAGAIMYSHSSNRMDFGTASDTVMNLNSSGDLNIGSGNSNHDFYSARLNVSDTSSQVASFTRYASTQNGPSIFLAKSRSATVGTNTIVQSGDDLGFVQFTGADGSAYQPGARIYAEVDGTPGANDMPGRLIFDTTPDGASAGVERMRITNDGSIGFGGVNPVVGYHFYTPSGVGGLLVSRSTTQAAAPSHYISVDSSKVVNQIYGDNGFVFEIAEESGTLNEAYRIQANRNFTINTAHDVAVGSSAKAKVQILGQQDINLSITGQGNNTDGGIMVLGKTRGTYGSSNTIVQDGDTLGEIRFGGDDGVDIQSTGARIFARVSATPGANDMPGEVVIQTTSDGNASPSDRVIINETGLVSLINTNSVASGNRPTSIYIARSDNNSIPVISMGPADEAQSSVSPGAMISSENRGFIIGTQNSLAATNMQGIHFNNGNNTAFYSQGSQRMTIDGSGRVLINLTSDIGTSHKLQVNDDISILTFNGTTTGADGIRFIKSRASTPGSKAIVADGDDIGFLDFRADDGTDYSTRTAVITSQVDGTPGTNDMPGNLKFYTTPDGGSSVVERMRIDNAGDISILESGTVRGVWKVESNDNIHFGATSGGGAGLQFWGAGGTTPNIGPLKEMGASDNEVDFGRSSERFNDIFLGGGVRFDAGATANYLDDYEEGTWTPSLKGTTTAGTWTSSGGTPNGRYTKIGETYICTFELTGTLSGAAGDVQIAGLPTSSGANDQGWYATWWNGLNTGVYTLFGHLTASGAGMWVKQTTSASTTAGQMSTSNLGTGNITIRGVAVIDDSF